MVKVNNRQRASERQYRIGFADLTMDSLWDPDAEKYKVLCRMVHVTKASRHIGYSQATISTIFLSFFFYHYLMLLSGHVPTDHWIHQYTLKYLSQLLLAITLQLLLVGVMLYGLNSESRSFLLPYIIYASIAILAGCVQLGSDFVNMDNNGSVELGKVYSGHSQLLSHLVGTMIHAWCLSVIWRCYGYFGEKKMARRIGEQLSATQAAFQYPDQLLAGYMPMPQPPPYADTVYGPNCAPLYRQPILSALPPNNLNGAVLSHQPIVVDAAPLIKPSEEEKAPIHDVV